MFDGQARSGESWVSVCPECMGEGCGNCSGRKFIRHTTPPDEGLTEAGLDLFQAYVWMKNFNQSPSTGGMLQQPARFVKAVQYILKVTTETMVAKKSQGDDVEDFIAKGMKKIGK